jgi:predicted nicotinamide N-methyase
VDMSLTGQDLPVIAAVRAGASTWTEQTAPAWAVSTLHEPDLTRDLAIWRAAHDVADSDPRPTG